MKLLTKTFALLGALSLGITSCKKDAKDPAPQVQSDEVSQAVKDKISALGYTSSTAQKIDEGYLVEGDIVITETDLNSVPENIFLRIADDEQYRTNNLVTGLPRNITIRVSSSLPGSYVTATNAAIARYNAQGLRVTFSRVTSGGNIVITAAPSGSGYLASAGFPSGGNPYNSVKVNRSYLDTWNANTVASIIAHEVGHCIGFRHSDYMSRQYSCGGSPVNEGASTVGAVHIPGTPTGPAAGSWMLACIGNGVNRPFNSSDITALNYVY
ncbi:MAG TPA: M57 family metalloprotease [Chitinophagaceae bacterium]|nr:M57 family metalloprotease [Chitinophagaceae bacterium]